MDKILICGPRGVGKSTLIRRLTALYPGPVSGFVTKRETVADGEGLFPIYIHPGSPAAVRPGESDRPVQQPPQCPLYPGL